MKHTHHHLLISFAVAVVILTAALYVFMSVSVGSMTEDAITAQGQVVAMRTGNTKEQRAAQIEKSSADQLDKLSAAFVPVGNAVPFIESLESIGLNSGSALTVSSISDVKAADGDAAVNGYVNAKVEAHGTWSAVMKTLMLAENLPFKSTISDVHIDLAVPQSARSGADWHMSFDIQAVKSIQR